MANSSLHRIYTGASPISHFPSLNFNLSELLDTPDLRNRACIWSVFLQWKNFQIHSHWGFSACFNSLQRLHVSLSDIIKKLTDKVLGLTAYFETLSDDVSSAIDFQLFCVCISSWVEKFNIDFASRVFSALSLPFISSLHGPTQTLVTALLFVPLAAHLSNVANMICVCSCRGSSQHHLLFVFLHWYRCKLWRYQLYKLLG